MKRALVAGGIVAVTTLTTGLGAAAAPGHHMTNSGLCVASGYWDRAADPSVGRGPAVRDVSDDGPDRWAQGPFVWSVACVAGMDAAR